MAESETLSVDASTENPDDPLQELSNEELFRHLEETLWVLQLVVWIENNKKSLPFLRYPHHYSVSVTHYFNVTVGEWACNDHSWQIYSYCY